MTNCRTYFIVLIALSFFLQGITQERSGLSLGNHNGVNATYLNPTGLLNNPHKWTANLGGAHLFADTDYVKIKQVKLFRFLRNYDQLLDDIRDNVTTSDVFTSYKENGKSYGDLQTSVLGPAFQYHINQSTSIGMSIRSRLIAGSYNITDVANYPVYSELDSLTVLTAEPFNGNAAAYTEINLHLAKQISPDLSVGITAKYLRGYEALHFSNRNSFDIRGFDEDNIDVLEGGSFDLAHTSPEENTINRKGRGIGIDLGFTIKNMGGSKGTDLGIALLDLGLISYSGSKRTYRWESGLLVDGTGYDELRDLTELDEQLAQDFILESTSDRFSQALPTGLAVQMEHKLYESFSLCGYWVQRLKVLPLQIARSNSLNITGLYELKHFSAFLPVTLYNYNNLRVGAAVRLAYLTIGTDNLLRIVGNGDFSGTDLYVNIQIYPFQIKRKNNGKGGKNIECFSF